MALYNTDYSKVSLTLSVSKYPSQKEQLCKSQKQCCPFTHFETEMNTLLASPVGADSGQLRFIRFIAGMKIT